MTAARPLLLGLGIATLSACASAPRLGANVNAVLSDNAKDAPHAGRAGGDIALHRAPFLSGPPLDDLAVATLTIANSPALQAARAQAGISEAQIFAAGLLPDPQLQLTLDHPTNFAGVDAMGATIGLDFISQLVSRTAGHGRSRAEKARVRNELVWTEWTTAMRARDAAIRAIYLRRQVAVARTAREDTQTQLQRYERAVAAGDAKLDDLALKRVAYLDASDRLGSLERDLAAALSEVRGHLGIRPDEDAPLVDQIDLRDPSGLDSAALFSRAVAQRRDFAALQAGFDANEAALRRARVAALPLPNLTLSRARDTSDVHTSGGGLSLVLPIWNRGRGDIAIARATRAQLQAEYADRLFQTRADIAAALDAIVLTARRRTDLEKELDDLTREVAVLSRASERGDVSALVYQTARSALFDKRLADIALAASQAQGEAALEGLVGGLIWSRGAAQ